MSKSVVSPLKCTILVAYRVCVYKETRRHASRKLPAPIQYMFRQLSNSWARQAISAAGKRQDTVCVTKDRRQGT